MSKLLKKLTISFLAFLVLFTSIAPSFFIAKAAIPPPSQSSSSTTTAPAEGTWYNQSFDQWYNKVYDENTSPGSEIFGERYTAAQVQWVIYSLFAFVINASLGNSSTSQKAVACFITSSANIETCAEPLKALLMGSAVNKIPIATQTDNRNLLQLVFADRPLSGITYVKERIRKFSLVPTAYAQSQPGFGFDVLKPIQDMWRGVRNIAFGLFVVVAVVLAFMIMFRVKISPQVVISVQSAIPKLIFALVLVTFSYAIAGFLIDLMYVVIGIFSIAMSPMLFNINPLGIFRLLTIGQATTANINFGFIGLGVIYLILFILSLVVILALNIGVLGGAIAAGALSLLSGITGGLLPILLVILVIVLAISVIWFFLKIFWVLIKAFSMIIILTIFAPLQIVLGVVVPSFGFGQWIRSFIANLSTFIVAGVLILMSFAFLFQSWKVAVEKLISIDGIAQFILGGKIGGLVDPNLGSAAWPPLLGGGNSNYSMGLLFLGVSFIMFTLIPKAAEIIQGFITGKPFAYGSAIGEAFGPVVAAGGFGADIAKSLGRDFATGFIQPRDRGERLSLERQRRAQRNVPAADAPGTN